MLDRQKIETILSRRFPGAPGDQLAAAVNAIMGLGDEWEELDGSDICSFAGQVADGAEFRLLRRRAA